MLVSEVMTPATVTDSPADPLRSAASRMWGRQQTGSLLDMSGEELRGILTQRDVASATSWSPFLADGSPATSGQDRLESGATAESRTPMTEPSLPDQTTDDTDAGWGEQPDADEDRRFLDERPPHHDR